MNIKITILIALLTLLSGCAERTPVTATIVMVTDKDSDAWGCIGTNFRTVVETEDGHRDRICGIWGQTGDKINGYWIKGHIDPIHDGFRPH